MVSGNHLLSQWFPGPLCVSGLDEHLSNAIQQTLLQHCLLWRAGKEQKPVNCYLHLHTDEDLVLRSITAKGKQPQWLLIKFTVQ